MVPDTSTYAARVHPTAARRLAHSRYIAAMLMVLATTSKPQGRGQPAWAGLLLMLAARPSPVTQPMRADSIWMPIISRVVIKGSDQRKPKLGARLGIGGDARWDRRPQHRYMRPGRVSVQRLWRFEVTMANLQERAACARHPGTALALPGGGNQSLEKIPGTVANASVPSKRHKEIRASEWRKPGTVCVHSGFR